LTSYKAGLNPGIATTIWSLCPFIAAVVDYLIWSVHLKPFHFLGMTMMVLCGVLISISNILITEPEPEGIQVQTMATWVPVLVALACNVVFVMSMTSGKYVTV
jgi:drug/metabolite transporter (DMT)-like permease